MGQDLFGVDRPNPTALLTTLAVINATWQHQGRTYLDNFVPFVVEVMREDACKAWSENEIRDRLAGVFGLLIPAKVAGSLLRRAAQRGDARRDHNLFTLTNQGSATDRARIGAAQAECRRQQKHLADSLTSFANERFGFQWNPDEAEGVLAEYIELHAVPLLASSTRGTSADSPQGPVGEEYIVGIFVAEVISKDPVLFGYLDQMVKGSMLASALYLSVESDIDRKFSQTTLFLDTPILLKALGFEGPEAEAATVQVIHMAVRQEARVACFEHVLKETRNVLDGARASLASAKPRPDEMAVLAHFRASNVSPADVEILIGRLEQKVVALGASIVAAPTHVPHLGVDEDKLEALMQDRIKYTHRNSLLTDLDSLTAIHRLRGGSSQPHLERCKALLVTDNDRLVAVGREFFGRREHQWPLAMIDNDVAALVWLKEPQQYPDLPRAQVIADCAAAHAPSPPLWDRVSEEIDRLEARGDIAEADIALLRYSREATQAIMETTLGDPVRANTAAIHRALAKARERITQPVREELNAARGQAAAALLDANDLNAQNAELEAGLRASADSIASLKLEVSSRKADVEELTRQRDATIAAVSRSASARARRVRLIVVAIAGLLTVAGLAALVPAVSAALPSAAVASTGVLGGLGLVTGVFGSIPDLAKRFETFLSGRWTTRELRRLGLEE